VITQPDASPSLEREAAADELSEALASFDVEGGSALWPGDTGSMRAPSRRALVQLLRGPYLSADRHGKLWGALLNDEAPIRSRLADLYLDLVVDTEAQVAFVRNVDSVAADAPHVVRTATLTFMDTAMLLHLRHQLLSAGGAERVIVGQDEVTDQLGVYREGDNADPAGYAKRINASWTKLVKYGILAPTSTEGRFEISPVLRLVFGAEQIAAVQAEYSRLATPAPALGTPDSLFDLDGAENS
jgi:Domain of unknown function (DUF4194)